MCEREILVDKLLVYPWQSICLIKVLTRTFMQFCDVILVSNPFI